MSRNAASTTPGGAGPLGPEADHPKTSDYAPGPWPGALLGNQGQHPVHGPESQGNKEKGTRTSPEVSLIVNPDLALGRPVAGAVWRSPMDHTHAMPTEPAAFLATLDRRRQSN